MSFGGLRGINELFGKLRTLKDKGRRTESGSSSQEDYFEPGPRGSGRRGEARSIEERGVIHPRVPPERESKVRRGRSEAGWKEKA